MYSINIDNNPDNYRVTFNLESHIDGNGTVIAPYHNNPMIKQIEDTIEEIYPFNEISKVGKKYITNDKIISTEEDIKEHFSDKDDKYFIKGSTDSKFSLLDLSFPMDRAMALEKESDGDQAKTLLKNPRIDELQGLPLDQITQDIREELDNGIEEVVSVNPITPTPEIRYGKRIEISGTNVVGMILLETKKRVEYVLYLDTPNPIFYVDNPGNFTRFKYMRNNIDDKVKPTLNLYSDTIDEPKVLSEVFIDRGVNNAFEPIRKLKNIKDLNELTKSGFGYYKINTKGYDFKD